MPSKTSSLNYIYFNHGDHEKVKFFLHIPNRSGLQIFFLQHPQCINHGADEMAFHIPL